MNEHCDRGSLSSGCGRFDTARSIDEHDATDDDMTFCMSNYAKEALKMMFMMRSHGMLTDVVLEVKKELFHAHKVILSAASPYFKAMFTGGLKESEMSRVQLQGVCPTAMTRILYFMYTGQIRVTEVTVCQLLPAATMFQVQNVIDACCAFLERQLDPTNAIGIANFAEQHGCIELQKKANFFIERHFTQVCQEEEFLQLSAYQLIALIRRDELNVQEEREVYNAVLKWVKYDEDNRHSKMEHILVAVRCQFLTPNFLKEQMKNCDVLRKVPACREYLAKIFKDLTLHKCPGVKERTPNTTRMIFVAGGFFRHSLDILEAYNVDDKTWTTLPNLRIPRSGLGAAFLKGKFYAVGGRNNNIGSSYDSDWVDRYSAITETWRPCSPMSVPRHRVGVAVMDELMYAVGGSAGMEYHNTVEYYDPDQDRWTLVQSMHSKRLGVGVVVVNRLLYAIGGFDGNERLASVECYHPENNEWSYLPPLKTGRSGAGVAAIDQYIYVVGGFDGTRQLATVERYNTDNESWDMVAPIQIARSALSLTPLDGKLYAIGGFDGNNFLSIVEVYDPRTNTWEQGTPLNSGRSGHASAVIYQPSCATTFMDYEDCEMSRSDGSNGDMQSDSSRDPSGSLNKGFGGGSPNMQFHASYGAGGCNNCDSMTAVKQEPTTELRSKQVVWEQTSHSGRFRKIPRDDYDVGDPDPSSSQTILPMYSPSHLEDPPNSESLRSKLAIDTRRCILSTPVRAMQNMFHRGIEWHNKKGNS
ncbi:kelch-like ECH-associated protein 1B isoform X1 [Drosophila albomicans]|uniref:Kelch-like ECH-associated protein 1B isoform X1 n=2 Tax=Drosophila albomicans TaxID=7291 RepID=A0A6P8XVP3_DROAB|nr:kelch-like ECH-associated protein 1B isoform X1 [Drosophila albomicans]XP_034117464.1 kelch-like ECH-associated protein 1B isoform X1 [Drosophila albomicans]XP_034117465.1 kelch-like ECH-associated protein 1B isoform X1 [Drosophila albomicans]XP_051864096.1 kelch-like ECH-associated protein 1B isoform X1 [Drosophila albomicans]XP_051864097.1 kelch-like ECH-associated protein 1B isoform X1 [Drosophila albomicans]